MVERDPISLSPSPASVASPGFDTSRVRVRGVFGFFFGFFVVLGGLLLLTWLLQRRLQGASRIDMFAHLNDQPALQQPLQPSPGHFQLPAQDMAALRATQEQRLHSTGPLPNDARHHHISIEDAMDQLLKSGALSQPWRNPTTQPYLRPREEKPVAPSVENRT